MDNNNNLYNRQGEMMIRQTVFPFKLEKTEEEPMAQGGLALFAKYNHGMGLGNLVNRYLPPAGSNRGFAALAFVETLVLMLQVGGRCLEDMRDLRRESALLGLVQREVIPDPDTLGDWLWRMGTLLRGRKAFWDWAVSATRSTGGC